MKRLLLGLAVTLGLCLGLGASAQATPPPSAAPARAAHVLVLAPSSATAGSTVPVGPTAPGTAQVPAEQASADSKVSRCRLPGVSTVCKKVADYLSSKWPVVKSWAQKSWTFYKAQMLWLWKQVPTVIRGLVEYFLIEFLLWTYDLWH